MAAISVNDRKALETLAPVERKIIELGLFPKITEGDPMDVTTEMIAIITTAFTRAGQKLPEDDGVTLALYADEFYSMLIEIFPRVTIAEVKEAMKAGVYGKAGKYYGLNPVSFLQFVEHYLFTEERKAAKKVFDRKSLLIAYEREVMTPAQKEDDDKAFINYLFSDHLKGQLLVDFIPSFVYDILVANDLLKLPREQKESFVDRAQSYITRLSKSNKLAGSRESFEDQLQTMNPDQTIITAAKQFAVFDFFETCKTEGKQTIFSKPNLISE